MSLCVDDRLVCRSEWSWCNWFSWWWLHSCPKRVENRNKYIRKTVHQAGLFRKISYLNLLQIINWIFFFDVWTAPGGPRPPHYRCFTITLRHTTLVTTPLDERSARHRELLPNKTQHSQQRDIHAPGGIRTRNPPQANGRRLTLRQRGHWDQLRPWILVIVYYMT